MLDIRAETALLAVASIIGWGYMLFFVMAFRLTGPFVVMIYEMLFNDVLRFFIIYMVFLAGFSQAFFVLFENNGKLLIDTERLHAPASSRFQWFSHEREAEFPRYARRF